MVLRAQSANDPPLGDTVREATHALATPVLEPRRLPVLEGEVPSEIEGVLHRNGPGRQSRGGVTYGHPFDGDGFVQRFEFGAGSVDFRARWVQTEEWKAEEESERILFRAFGTNRPGGVRANALRLRFKNAANTSIVRHAGRTLALWEGGVPHEIDPVTLETRGRYDFQGSLRNDRTWFDRWLNPELPFAAHPRRDPHTGELVSFGAAYGIRPHLLVHRVDRTGRLETQWIGLRRLPFVHDFVLTRNWCVFLLPAVSFDVPSALLGTVTPVQSLVVRDEPGELLLVPRGGGPVVRVEGPQGFVFHWANGFEREQRVVLEGMHYPAFPRLEDVVAGPEGPVPRPMRIEIDLSASTARWSRLSNHLMELPTTAGAFDAPAPCIWGVAAPPNRKRPIMSGIGRLQSDRMAYRELAPNLPSEPIPVCGGRWLLANVWRPDRFSELWVLDGTSLETVARVGLPARYPVPLHGTWTPEFGSDE